MNTRNIHNELVKVVILPHEYAALYREFFNDYLTIDCFAEALMVHPKAAARIIKKGYVLHNDIFGNQ